MATLFLEPGGDGTFILGTQGGSGFWQTKLNAPVAVTDFVNSNHIYSYQFRPAVNDVVATFQILAAAGARISTYVYLAALPGATATLFQVQDSAGINIIMKVRVTSAGILQLWSSTAQVGSSGSTLVTGKWYRICLAYTISSTSSNQFRLFIQGKGAVDITASNVTIASASPSVIRYGNMDTDASLDIRLSDFYVDNASTLVDTGNILVTAKRPYGNGTTNNFTTQIGSGGSGYPASGGGHAPQVNERPLSTTNGWSMIGAGSAVTEEYSIEAKGVGDMDLTNAKIIDFVGWVYADSVLAETASIIVAGSSSNISLLANTPAMFTKVAGSTTYPAGGTDIGLITSTTVTTVNLFECGVLVAFTPQNRNFFAFFDEMNVG